MHRGGAPAGALTDGPPRAQPVKCAAVKRRPLESTRTVRSQRPTSFSLGFLPASRLHGTRGTDVPATPLGIQMNTETGDAPLADIQREYLDDLRHRVTPAHHRNVEQRLGRTLTALGAVLVSDLRPLEVIRFRNQRREEGASNRTANLVVDSLRSMLTWALECGLIDGSPLGRIRRLPDGAGHQRCVRRALTDDEITRFLDAARADDLETARLWRTKGGGEGNKRRSSVRVPQAPMWRAFLETGARWSELTRSTWADMDLSRRTLVLRAENTKARRRRIVPLGGPLVAALRQLRLAAAQAVSELGDADPVFWTPEGARWSRSTNNAMRIFNRVLKRAGIARVDVEGRKVDIHALRHTFGTRMARSGAGLVHVQRLLGHADPKLTAQVYTHLDVEDLRGAIDAAIG